MDTDARGIIGCTDLDRNQVNLINRVKTLEGVWNAVIDELRVTRGVDQRQVAIAATEGEGAFMRIVRAVEVPQRLTIPTEALVRLEEA